MFPASWRGADLRCPVANVFLWLGAVTAAATALTGLPAAAAEPGNAYVALTTGFREGDFGTAVDNRLYSLTPEVGYVSDNYDFSAAVPFHRLDISGGGVSSTHSGMGDALLRGGGRLWRSEGGLTSLYGALGVKLATGDENNGLGTGGTDIGVSLSATRKSGAYAITALLGYTQVGEPSGVTYDDVVSYGVGLSRRFTRSNVFASVQGQTSSIPGGTDPRELDVGFFRMLSSDYVVIAHTLVGLSDGSPDRGLEIGVVRWFR